MLHTSYSVFLCRRNILGEFCSVPGFSDNPKIVLVPPQSIFIYTSRDEEKVKKQDGMSTIIENDSDKIIRK